MAARAQSWQHLFDPATGYVQARGSDGAFPPGPAMQYMSATAIAMNDFQPGFAEGNAIQYTWSVPQDLADLFALMGGDAAVTVRTWPSSPASSTWAPGALRLVGQ